MKPTFRKLIPVLVVLLAAHHCATQGQVGSVLTMGFGDVAATKQKAEAGDPKAELAYAGILAGNFRHADAFPWYEKAAANGFPEAYSQIGSYLLFGATGLSPNQGIQSKPAEGLKWAFRAATNHQDRAYYDLYRAYQQGLGTAPDPIQAYAWLTLSANTLGGIGNQVQLNQLALTMDTPSLLRGKALAEQFKQGHWIQPVAKAIPDGDSRLKLQSITIGTKTSLAAINGQIFAEGESATIPLKPGKDQLTLKCLKIQKDSVLVLVQGEDSPRLLRTK